MTAVRVSLSNLAWPAEDMVEALGLLRQGGATGVEVAPTRIAPWDELRPEALTAYRHTLQEHGLAPSSLQAIFFGAPEAQLLGDETGFEAMQRHLRKVGVASRALQAPVCVFGAPRNRNRHQLAPERAMELAVQRLGILASLAADEGLLLAMEPVPAAYNSDFLMTWEEVVQLVRAVDHHAVRLHLDTACVTLGGGSIADAIRQGAGLLAHFHAAQPQLTDFGAPLPAHAQAGAALKDIAYAGWVCIEMLQQPDWRQAIQGALSTVAAAYAR
ncbi:sugar phosphate isomerase/epimerase [Rhodovarius crocodyli]|uniref:Sugar phosphate isomerase/epimerase n=1 Tax=Rhodovarius crocodyli TaxID=1979269 RepID=A0A437MM08_9PROT|nr:sugar phosphate isomerase/epimerase family protein [Rhodovarius crocodyli]RVT98659.1 sugar phosphate isomerase/epimerase [Rhodovarius crocodyli]